MRARTSKLTFIAVLATLPASSATAQAIEPEYVEEMEILTARQAVRDALSRVETLDAWGMDRLVELTEIPAPPFMEEVRAARFAELLQEAGADSVWIDAEGNALGLRRGRGGGGTVAFGAHLDTVFPEGTDVSVRMRGDTLYAPGVGDDTRGLVVVLTVLRAMEEANVETSDDVLFIGTVGEEGLGDLRGMKYLFREGAEPIDAWIEIDGGGLSRLGDSGSRLGSLPGDLQRARRAFLGCVRVGQSGARAEQGCRLFPGCCGFPDTGRTTHELQRGADGRGDLGQRHPLRGVDGGRHAVGESGEPGSYRAGLRRRDESWP